MRPFAKLWVLVALFTLAMGCSEGTEEEQGSTPTTERCQAPTVSVGDITKNTATISWNSIEGAISYTYKVMEGATSITTDNTTTCSVTIENLTPTTTYRVQVRAMAQSAEQSSIWSPIVEFTTLRRNPDEGTGVDAIVAKDGSGDYLKVQEALDNIPSANATPHVIYIKEGTYKEKLSIGAGKDNVILVGDGKDKTILSWDGYQGNGESVYSTLYIRGKDVTVMDMTIENTHQNNTGSGDQAQAVHIHYGDRVAFYDCNITGYQDTVWGRSYETRVYMRDCFVEGNVDYIYGGSIMVLEDCQLHVNRDAAAITAPSTQATSKFGITFLDCEVTHDEVGFNGKAISTIYLGRAWHNASKSVWIRCQMPAALDAKGWMQNMADDVDDTNKIFAEWGCTYADNGDADMSKRLYGGRALTDDEAAEYTLANIFATTANPAAGFEADWMPAEEKPYINLNK